MWTLNATHYTQHNPTQPYTTHAYTTSTDKQNVYHTIPLPLNYYMKSYHILWQHTIRHCLLVTWYNTIKLCVCLSHDTVSCGVHLLVTRYNTIKLYACLSHDTTLSSGVTRHHTIRVFATRYHNTILCDCSSHGIPLYQIVTALVTWHHTLSCYVTVRVT